MQKVIVFSTIMFFVGFGSVVHANQYLSNQLLGVWECSSEYMENEMTVKATGDFDYVRNGKYNAFYEMSLVLPPLDIFPEGVSLDYLVANTGTWEITNGKFLIETSVDLKITKTSFPANDIESRLANIMSKTEIQEIKQMFEALENTVQNLPTGISQSSEIITLNDESLVAVSESNGIKVNCSRKKKEQSE